MMNRRGYSFYHYFVMFIISITAGLLSTMSVYANKIDDVRISFNDIYMSLLMTVWMFSFMSLYYGDFSVLLFGIFLVLSSFWAIRTQLFVNQNEYLQGMIPHHSMAVFMSKKLLEKGTHIKEFVEKIVSTQENEIKYMKTKAT